MAPVVGVCSGGLPMRSLVSQCLGLPCIAPVVDCLELFCGTGDMSGHRAIFTLTMYLQLQRS